MHACMLSIRMPARVHCRMHACTCTQAAWCMAVRGFGLVACMQLGHCSGLPLQVAWAVLGGCPALADLGLGCGWYAALRRRWGRLECSLKASLQPAYVRL